MKRIFLVVCIILLIGGGIQIHADDVDLDEFVASLNSALGHENEMTACVVYDSDAIRISISDIEYTDAGAVVHLLYENHTDQAIRILPRAYAVNSAVEEWEHIDAEKISIAAGKKNTDTIDTAGVQVVYSIDVCIYCYDADSNLMFKKRVHAGDNTKTINLGTEIYRDEKMRVTAFGKMYGGYAYCVTNLSNDYYAITIEDISVNDFTLNGLNTIEWTDMPILPKCQTVFIISFADDNKASLEEKAIDNVDRIDFSFLVSPNDDPAETSYRTSLMGCEVNF